MNNLKELCFSKSFCLIGNTKSKCFNCSYCRAITKDHVNYEVLPTEINPIFTNLPVVVNIFYGDPLLQIDNTLRYLKRLEEAKHKAPVLIITKGDATIFPDIKFDLDLHFAFSTFGMDSVYDGGNLNRFINNLDYVANKMKNKYKYSIEFRPIIKGINDSFEVLENVIRIAEKFNTAVGFCGLQLNDNLKEYLKEQDIIFEAYEGYELGLKKAISKEVEDKLYYLSEIYNVPIFRKTSCLISYTHNLERDLNAHYYRPNEMRCNKCVMRYKCMNFKSANDKKDISEIKLPVDIPFKYEIINKQKHICILYKNGLCKFPNQDCVNISGKMLKIDEEITSSDLRVIKWLTGFTIDCNFKEIEFISSKWLQK